MTEVHQIWYAEHDGAEYPTRDCYFSYEDAHMRLIELNNSKVEVNYFIKTWDVK